MVTGLVIGHRDLSSAVEHVLESVSGEIRCFDFISNDGLSTEELTDRIRSQTGSCGSDGLMIFVDIFGGSCWRAAKRAKSDNAHILSGFNIPMLLSFIHKRETMPFDELVRAIEYDGKRAVKSD